MAPLSVRARLTLWHAGVLLLVVCLFAAGSLLFVRARLYAELDAQLTRELSIIERVYREQPYELADLPGDRGFLFFQIAEKETPRHESDGWRQIGFQRALNGASTGAPASWAAADGTWFRVQSLAQSGYRIAAAVDETAVRHIVSTLGVILLLGIPFAVGLAIAGGYFLAGRVLAPVGAMADKARRIGAASLGERLAVPNPGDEFGRLAAAFNETLARVEQAFEQLRRFTADASHELRTPLTAMRSVGEVALQSERQPRHYRDVIGSMLEEVDRLTNLADSLLTLTRADSGKIELKPQAVDLGELAAAVAEQLRILAEEKHQALALDGNGRAQAWGDAELLRLALTNLVHNAIKYTPPGGTIQLRVQSLPDAMAAIEVRDTGPGIPVEERELIFERFYRLHAARSSAGAGLGLAIARWAVTANNGRIAVESGGGGGSVFRIVLPQRPT
jgi:heavy metal sensor kinase